VFVYKKYPWRIKNPAAMPASNTGTFLVFVIQSMWCHIGKM